MPKPQALEFDGLTAKVLLDATARFTERVGLELSGPIRDQLRGYHPRELAELEQELQLLAQQLASGVAPFVVHEIHARLLKAVVARQRRSLAASIDAPRRRTGDRYALRYLEKELRVLDSVVHRPWFARVEIARLPRLTDYLSVRFAELALGDLEALAPRVYDEKFHILEAPSLLASDLAYYRQRCALRQLPLALAYLDIDGFKAFNTRYGEPRVDRDLLPAFMECLEGHVFAHGHAYRFGGDEYVVLLPNSSCADAVEHMRRFQSSLRRLKLAGIDELPTVSVGVCPVESDSILTDSEALERANRAKSRAKSEGKRCVAWYTGELYRDEDILCPPS